MVRKIQGKGKSSSLGHLNVNNKKVTSKKDISNILADAFSKNSSSENYTQKFKNIKQQKEKRNLKFSSDNSETYNQPFSLSELKDALSKAHDSSPGSDDIHYQFLKHLPDTSLSVLLKTFNDIWETGNVPKSWKETTIIPIPKPGKDNANPNNYRPIALTSCICKTLEHMINERLVWYLEKNNIITEFQSGFRHQRSTNDYLVRLETFIREAFIKKEHLVAVFFDLEKAFDTTWKYGIMNDLQEIGLKIRLPIFVQNFLSKREFKVRVGSTLSEAHNQEQGVPQGSIFSVTLFSLKINNIVKCLNPGVDCSLYVDDFLICYRSKNMNTIERQFQLNLNKIQKWSTENGFKFSKSKTVCMHFCHLRKAHNDPILTLDGTPIPVVEENKFQGVIFDRKLSFIPHIKQLKAKCQKALNLLRVVAHTDWGADRKVLLNLYRTIIRSKLDYGSIIYGSARKSYLKMLDPIHHQGLRLALGAFRTSPSESLLAEANEPSLFNRRLKLSMQYALKLESNPSNTTYETVFEPQYKTLFENKPNMIPSFGIRISSEFDNMNLDLDNIADFKISEVPPWTFSQPRGLFSLHNDKKSQTDPIVFRTKFHELLSDFPNYETIFTDGSKDDDTAGSACVTPSDTYKCRLPDNASIFSAEIKAIDLALDHIERSRSSDFIIFSDSLSVLQSLHNRHIENPLLLDVLLKHNELAELNRIVFCWLPSHVGIKGNEKADIAAKSVLTLNISDLTIPFTDFKPSINTFVHNKWQMSWNAAVFNKLHFIKPSLGERQPNYRIDRKEEVTLARLRIGHTFITHSFLLKGEDWPLCIPCQEPFSVKHFLLDCTDFRIIRSRFYRVNSLKELFDTVEPVRIFSFLKEIGLYDKI